jgi:hypothetical protein
MGEIRLLEFNRSFLPLLHVLEKNALPEEVGISLHRYSYEIVARFVLRYMNLSAGAQLNRGMDPALITSGMDH